MTLRATTLRFAVNSALPLLLTLAAVASAQTDTPPPMKMGLWQNDVTIQMSGMPNGVTMPPRSITSQSCMTSDTWKSALQHAQNNPQTQGVICTTSNVQQDAHHYTADVQCTAQQGMTSNIHVDMQFDSDESMHGSTTMSVSGPNVPQGMTMNSTIQGKYLGSDCGDVKPGHGKIVASPDAPPH